MKIIRLLMLGVIVLAVSANVFAAEKKMEEEATLESLPKDLKGYLIPFIINEPDIAIAAKNAAAILRTNKEYSKYRGLVIEALKNQFFKTKKEAQDKLFKLAQDGTLTQFALEVLLAAGVDLNAQDNYGDTALITAASRGYKKIVAMLIKAKVNLDIQDKYNYTALMKAADYGLEDIVAMLITAKANLDKQDNNGYTALDLAKIHKYKKIEKMLEQAMSEQRKQEQFLQQH